MGGKALGGMGLGGPCVILRLHWFLSNKLGECQALSQKKQKKIPPLTPLIDTGGVGGHFTFSPSCGTFQQLPKPLTHMLNRVIGLSVAHTYPFPCTRYDREDGKTIIVGGYCYMIGRFW
jgi:hypothetical protein